MKKLILGLLLIISTSCLSQKGETFQTFNDTITIEIVTAVGDTQRFMINTSTWRNGVYFIKIGDKSFKLIKGDEPKKEYEYIKLN